MVVMWYCSQTIYNFFGYIIKYGAQVFSLVSLGSQLASKRYVDDLHQYFVAKSSLYSFNKRN